MASAQKVATNLKQVWMAPYLGKCLGNIPETFCLKIFHLFHFPTPCCPGNSPETEIKYRTIKTGHWTTFAQRLTKKVLVDRDRIDLVKSGRIWRRLSIKLPQAWISENLRQPGDSLKWRRPSKPERKNIENTKNVNQYLAFMYCTYLAWYVSSLHDLCKYHDLFCLLCFCLLIIHCRPICHFQYTVNM